jgi:ribosome modulation factor
MNMVNEQEVKEMQTAITLEQNPNDESWTMRTKAYRNGYIARAEGQSRAAQPYGKNTTSHMHWTLGWRSADADMRIAS